MDICTCQSKMLSLDGCKQAESGNVTCWSNAQLHSAAQRYRHSGHTFALANCLRSRTVDVVTSISCNCTCLHSSAVLAPAEMAAHSTVYLLSWQTSIPSAKLPTICIWSTFDIISPWNVNTLFRPLFSLHRK